MEQQLNQHEKGISEAHKAFLDRKIEKIDAIEHIRHFTKNGGVFKSTSILLDAGAIEEIKSNNGTQYTGIRIYPAMYKKGVRPEGTDNFKADQETIILALTKTMTANQTTIQEDAVYFNYGQACPPGQHCKGDIETTP